MADRDMFKPGPVHPDGSKARPLPSKYTAEDPHAGHAHKLGAGNNHIHKGKKGGRRGGRLLL